jgi:uncharacterized membrane protein YcaP (DUF421 family)
MRPVPLHRERRHPHRALRREFMRPEELTAQLRLHGVMDLRDVAQAYFEPNGMISVLRRDRPEVDDARRPSAAG